MTVKKIEKIVPDTSVIIEGVLSKQIEKKQILPEIVLIHEAVLAELEHQANQNRSIGFLGLEELEKLNALSSKFGFRVEFAGKRPSAVEIKHAKLGEIDSLIREMAYENSATLLTADKIQAKIAKAKAVSFIFIEIEVSKKKIKLADFFDDQTMSVHLRENIPPYAKKGRPGDWEFVRVKDKNMTRQEIMDISSELVEETGVRKDCFIEIEREGSTIIQFENYRIVITKPPFADGWEITAVRPVRKLNLSDYALPEKVQERIAKQAEGILVAGAPGQGKSTFAQALAEFYAAQDKIVKTVEAPRDLQLPDTITQYAISHGSPQEIHDVLLLSRPDYTIFDEMRNTDDFRLFADMRLSGVGMIGIVHATNAIDAIQRFIGRIELGTIPQIIDTVLFIKNGDIGKIFEVKMEVKVPAGMTEADLARPIVTVYDFLSKKLEFEIYSYGEETVVVPVSKIEVQESGVKNLAAKQVERELLKYAEKVEVKFISEQNCVAKVPNSSIALIIGKQGQNIEKIQERLGVHIDIKPLEITELPKSIETKAIKGYSIGFTVEISKSYIEFVLDKKENEKTFAIYVNDEFLMQVHSGKKALIRISKQSAIGKSLLKRINEGEKVELRG